MVEAESRACGADLRLWLDQACFAAVWRDANRHCQALRWLHRVHRSGVLPATLQAAYLCHMQPPHVADPAPDEPFLTRYDMAHLVSYLRLLDADAEGAAWQEAARNVLSLDAETDPEQAKRAGAGHLARAKVMAEQGHRHLLPGGASH